MFTFIILLILLPVAFLPMTLATFFSSADLSEMGVCLENIPEASLEQISFQTEPLVAKITLACGTH